MVFQAWHGLVAGTSDPRRARIDTALLFAILYGRRIFSFLADRPIGHRSFLQKRICAVSDEGKETTHYT